MATRAHGGGGVSTVRQTAAQAAIRYLANQYVARPAGEIRYFAGVWAIFGHGNVAGLGEALHAAQDVLPTYRAHSEQGMAHAAIAYAKEHGAWKAMQFENAANPNFHAQTTAVEIMTQMEGRIDGFVAGVGTGGTFSGVAGTLKRELQRVHTVAVETEGSVLQGGPAGKHKVEGIGVSFVPQTFDAAAADEIVRVMDVDAFEMVKRLALEEGVLGGSSSGANVFAALQLAKKMQPGQRVVTIIPDSAERYLSKNIFDGGI